MDFDVFFSISQTPVDDRLPSEAEMFRAFLREVQTADALGYGVAWVAESHFSSEVQKQGSKPVVPHWKGEIGLNSQFTSLAQWVFDRTKRIALGSAVTNIVGMGGPIVAAERIAAALSWHGLAPEEHRPLHVGFSAGRFEFMNAATGIMPRNALEAVAWPALRPLIFREAAEIFIRLLNGETLAAADIPPPVLRRDQVWVDVTCAGCARTWQVPFAAREHVVCRACGVRDVHWEDALWQRVRQAGSFHDDKDIVFDRRWSFERLKIIPADWRRELLKLIVGSHDPAIQLYLNQFAPVSVFNLSITSPAMIEATHTRMASAYHPSGGAWRRQNMPRTTFVFLDADPSRDPQAQRAFATARARKALTAYWTALEGTIDPSRIDAAAENALIGNPADIVTQARARFHPDDRLMLWFDFFEHDAGRVCEDMTIFAEQIAPQLKASP